MAELAGAGLGIVVGWTLPFVRRRTALALAMSAVVAVVVSVALFVLAGAQGTLGGAVGMGVGALLHAAFLEYVGQQSADRSATTQED